MNKVILVGVLLTATTVAASAQYQTRGYNSGGYGTGSNPSSTYVAPSYNFSNGTTTSGHYRTTPNNTQYDNYGTRGNVNPYNGRVGTRSPRY